MGDLSKSKILAYKQCPKRLWLEVYKPNENVVSSSTAATFRTGNIVGDLAREIYDVESKGVLIEPFKDGFKFAYQETARLLSGNQPIFEAAFSGGGALALADVMLPVESGGEIKWNMIEVKSSTSVKDIYHADVAVQMYVAKAAGININRVSLAYIDSTWVYAGDSNYLGLLKESDLTRPAEEMQAEVGGWVYAARQILSEAIEPNIEIGDHCQMPYPCGFYEYCARNCTFAKFPIEWLPHLSKKKIAGLGDGEYITDMREVPDGILSEIQLRVKRHTILNSVYFDQSGAKNELAQYSLPAYFLDFETINLAVPIWAETRPYQQITFQYSLHILDNSGVLSHYEFLDISGSDPTRGFAEKLVNDCGSQGPVYVYNIGFERTKINDLAKKYEDLSSELLSIVDRLVDLLPVAKKYYYHPNQKGSWSIKNVLPAISPNLSYDELEGVQDGAMAMNAFVEAISEKSSSEDKEKIEEQLLKYCEMDTFAMVQMWQFFTGQRPG